MFRFYNFPNATHLFELLNQPDPSLEEVLDDEAVVYEVKNSNSKLISYLCRRDNFESLISYLIDTPENMTYDPNQPRKDEKLNKYPFVVADILSTDNDTISQYFLGLISDAKIRDAETETIPDDFLFDRSDSMNIEGPKETQFRKESLDHNKSEDTQMEIELVAPIRKFLRFLNSPVPINLTMAGYFAKVLKELFMFKPAQLSIALFESHFKYLQRMANHIYADSLGELLLTILKLDNPFFKSDAKDLYIEKRIEIVQQIILNLFEKPKDNFPIDSFTDLQINSSNLLKQLLSCGGDSCVSKSEILSPLFYTEVLNKIISNIVNPSLTEALVPLLTEICEYEGHAFTPKGTLPLLDLSNYSEPVSQSLIPDNEPFLIAIVASIDKLVPFISTENKDINPHPIDFQYGHVGYPFGKTRLQILELFQVYFKLQNETLTSKILESGLLRNLLKLYIKNPWSNIVHTSLSKIFNFILAHGPESLLKGLFEQVKVLDFIIAAVEHPGFQIKSKIAGKVNYGYMAYLYNLANTIEDTKYEFVKTFCANHQEWQVFKNNELKDVNDRNNTKLGGDPYSTTNSFSGFPRTTLYNSDIIINSDKPIHEGELDSGYYEEPEEEIKIDSDGNEYNRYIEQEFIVNSNLDHGEKSVSPTNLGNFADDDILERNANEMKYPQSVQIKKLLTDEVPEEIEDETGEIDAELEQTPDEEISSDFQ